MPAGATFDILWRIIDHMSADARISGLRQRDLDNENANAAVKPLSRSSVSLALHPSPWTSNLSATSTSLFLSHFISDEVRYRSPRI